METKVVKDDHELPPSKAATTSSSSKIQGFGYQLFETNKLFVILTVVTIGLFKIAQYVMSFIYTLIVLNNNQRTITSIQENIMSIVELPFSDLMLKFLFGFINLMDWNIVLVYLSCTGFILDLIFSSEVKQGNPALLAPTAIYLFIYMFSLLFDTYGLLTWMGIKDSNEGILSSTSFTHHFIINSTITYFMIQDFYMRISSRRIFYRFIMTMLVVASFRFIFIDDVMHYNTVVSSMSVLYIILRSTWFMAPSRSSGATNSYQRQYEFLMDPVPKGAGPLNTWVQKIPSPFHMPVFVLVVLFGILRFFVALGIYFFYVGYICLPISAVFFTLRRYWMIHQGQEHQVQGAIYGVFDPVVPGKAFPPKAVLIVTGHLRLICFKNKNNILFNIFFGWWLRPTLRVFVVFEIALPFEENYAPCGALLMEEFGPVFPFGDGLGFGTHKDVKNLMSNPKLRKGPYIFAWKVCTSHINWSANNMLFRPEGDNDAVIVKQNRELTRVWADGLVDKLKDKVVQNRLDAILPFANDDGTPIDRALLQTSFSQTFFHLLTDGEMTKMERLHFYLLLRNPFPFLSDHMNQICFSGLFECLGFHGYALMRKALLRYLDAPSLQRALSYAQEHKFDAWSPQEIVRNFAYTFVVGGGPSPASLLRAIINKLHKNPSLVGVYKQNKRKFILEVARLEPCVPVVVFTAHDFALANGDKYVTIFNKKIPVPDGTLLHCAVQNANRDVSVFGEHANELNFNRNNRILGEMLSFDGSSNDILEGIQHGNHDTPVRRCPGYGLALEIVEFLVDRFCPPETSPIPDNVLMSLKDVSPKEPLFTKIGLIFARDAFNRENEYFYCASDVIHPLDENGMALGSKVIPIAGGRTIPQNDECIAQTEIIKDNLLQQVIKYTSHADGLGEWESPAQAVAWRTTWFKSVYPAPNVDYASRYSEVSEIMSQMAFSGFCCLRTCKVSSCPTDSLAYKHANGAIYVNDATVLGDYKVRPGFERYGAAAYFDKDFNLIGIYTSAEDKYFSRPVGLSVPLNEENADNDNLDKEEYTEWRHAMWAWRVSSLALITVADHLVNVHLVSSNSLVQASRTYLPIDHPLRSFLKIFTFRAIGINAKAKKFLLARKGFEDRKFAFDTEDLQRLVSCAPSTFKKKFTDYIPESMRDEPNFPANHDLCSFYNIVQKLVHEIVQIYYEGPADSNKTLYRARLQRNIDSDVDLQAFLLDLANSLGIDKCQDLSTFEDIVEVLTTLICTVTGIHELVGHTSDYLAHPKVCGATLRPGKEIDSIETYQISCILVSATGLRMPKLMNNWEHMLNRDQFANKTVPVMRNFQQELCELSLTIEKVNMKRRFKMEAFNPIHMESSVSL